jgi:hypothetical protein
MVCDVPFQASIYGDPSCSDRYLPTGLLYYLQSFTHASRAFIKLSKREFTATPPALTCSVAPNIISSRRDGAGLITQFHVSAAFGAARTGSAN